MLVYVAIVVILSVLLSIPATAEGAATAAAAAFNSLPSSKRGIALMSSTASSSSSPSSASAPTTVQSHPHERYGTNIARYLLDLHDEGATFNFCGGMMFQLQLTDMLRSHLEGVASSSTSSQPIIHPSSMPLMNRIPNYEKSSFADNASVFHGRELRKVDGANGGMGFVLQLSYADPAGSSIPGKGDKGATASWSGKKVDPQGWSCDEIATYDGWRSDQVRRWRDARTYESEGFITFSNVFGEKAFGLNHRFFLHFDDRSGMWLCAEDGCEGTPSSGGTSLIGKIGGMLFGK